MILAYLKTFAVLKDYTIKESWHGVYAKLTNGESHVFFSPEPGVYVLNGLGGAGMTLSFGLAEEIVG
jgi:glycine/D-amino acid oxidase-like deaminating enzyme